MQVQFSTVTLPCADVEAELAFLEHALGLTVHARYGELVYVATGATRVALYPGQALAHYSAGAVAPGPGGVLLSLNFGTADDVDAAVARARAQGARIAREPAAFDWGGYGACLVDPEGHAWELVHAPGPGDASAR